jgi:hypothetical protein
MIDVIEVKRNSEEWKDWDIFVEESINGTIFHRLDFLDYHGNKFDESIRHLSFFKGKNLLAVMPLAIEGHRAITPFGGSYGGVVTKGVLSYELSQAIVTALIEFLKSNSVSEVIVTPTPQIYHNENSETLNFVLLEHGFRITNSDIYSYLDLRPQGELAANYSSSVKRNLKKAKQNPLKIEKDVDVGRFWGLLEKTFERHESSPTHSFDELTILKQMFPERIYFDVICYKGVPVSGIGRFIENKYVESSFYIVNDFQYSDLGGSFLLFDDVLNTSRENEMRYFNFGTSSVRGVARPNIFRFKEGFNAIGGFRHTYSLDIE